MLNEIFPAAVAPSRRDFLQRSVQATAALAATAAWPGPCALAADNEPAPPRYRIGVCDWMILKRQRLGAFDRAREIGVDGLEVDMGSLGDRDTFASALADAAVRDEFQAAAQRTNLQICSLAMSGFYAQSFAERPTYERMVGDCLRTMQQMGVKVCFLPLGVRGDLQQHPQLRPTIVERLQTVGATAAAAGLTIGVETALDAADEARLLDDIGSPAVRSYFNFANALQNGRDLLAELRTLGKQRICQIHCTDEDGVWLENNKRLDLPAVKQTLDEMDWSGWLVMERSRDATRSRDVVGNYRANARYLKRVFQGAAAGEE
ncbi:MAG: sugar phosphate isomerase/epimerase [Planctomycetales bacterium]|nr:sugar phosphate isomerase/epimerase [Planctomycetales bacterium]